MTRLLVVAGPIASGKSSLAHLLAARVVEAGLTVANLDVDDVARMAQGPDDTKWDLWESSHGPFAALVGGWLREHVDLVIAHGSLYTTDHIAGLRRVIPNSAELILVLMRASFDAALSRAVADPERGVSRNPEFLRGTHDRFDDRLRTSDVEFDYEIDTETTTLEEAASLILPRLVVAEH